MKGGWSMARQTKNATTWSKEEPLSAEAVQMLEQESSHCRKAL